MNNSLTNKKLDYNSENTDNADFKEIYLKYYQELCVYACSYTNDQGDAEDLVQNVLIKFLEKKSYINFEGNLRSYLYKSVYNSFLDTVRHQNKVDKSLEEVKYQLLSEIIEEESDSLNKRISILKEEIDKLPKKCKEIFVLCKFDGLKYSQVAKELNISTNTVENHISKAYKLLRKRLTDRDILNLFIGLLFKKKRIKHFA